MYLSPSTNEIQQSAPREVANFSLDEFSDTGMLAHRDATCILGCYLYIGGMGRIGLFFSAHGRNSPSCLRDVLGRL